MQSVHLHSSALSPYIQVAVPRHAGRAESGTTLESLTETSTQQYEIMAAVSRQSSLTVTWVEWHCSRLIIAVALGEQERMCATILKCGGLTWMSPSRRTPALVTAGTSRVAIEQKTVQLLDDGNIHADASSLLLGSVYSHCLCPGPDA